MLEFLVLVFLVVVAGLALVLPVGLLAGSLALSLACPVTGRTCLRCWRGCRLLKLKKWTPAELAATALEEAERQEFWKRGMP